MARGLADVLHHFLPDAEPAKPEPPVPADAPRVPTLAVPLGETDVVRAALAWNVGVELARLGGGVSLLTPATEAASTLWPEAGRGPLDTELVLTFAASLPELASAAADAGTGRASAGAGDGILLVRVPPSWLGKGREHRGLLDRVWILASPEPRELVGAYAMVKRCFAAGAASVGVSIHGVRSVCEAEQAFLRLARASERHLGRPLLSHGLLVDDVHLYRSIVSRRPIVLTHPHTPAARSVRDVARLLLHDLRGDGRG